MARYTGPDCRRCRREKMKLFLKGSKCDGPKCPFESRPFPPGQHGRGRPKETEYLLQLREKQKARQLVSHGHFLVNGKKVDIPSYRVREHEIIEVREKSRDLTPFIVAQAQAGSKTVPAWLESIPSQMKILVHALPARQVIDTQVQEQLIVELYSK